jgi:LPXTG-motif cell wall-anchored protein
MTGVNSACMLGNAKSAPAYQIRWKESDLSILQTHPLTPTAGPIGTRDNPSLATKSESPPSSKGSLGTGPKVGVAVGTVAGVILLIVAGFLLWRRRRQPNNKAAIELESDDGGHDAPEVVIYQINPDSQKTWGI